MLRRSLNAGSGAASAASLPDELDAVAAALSAAAGACDDAARRVLPAGARDESICSRFDRAAREWPVSPPPSRERIASILGFLDDAECDARRAAARCEQARRSLDHALGGTRDHAP
jgi:hypothetical protein